MSDPDEFDDFDDDGIDDLDAHEAGLVRQDLVDLEDFESTFAAEGYRGVSVFCHDCVEEHYYPWEMLRENLTMLLETGETPVHEPAFQPDPEQYVPWEYARGYIDALRDVGVGQRREVTTCARCGLRMPPEWTQANFCPRCGTPLLPMRLAQALRERGLNEGDAATILREIGLPDR